jgi:hypothetical protein
LRAFGVEGNRGIEDVDLRRTAVVLSDRHLDRRFEAITGSTLRPVMNLISSMAKDVVGSAIASVSVAPTFEMEAPCTSARLLRDELDHVVSI